MPRWFLAPSNPLALALRPDYACPSMSVTFKVDPVRIPDYRARSTSILEAWKARTKTTPESYSEHVLVESTFHPLIGAVRDAWNLHFPLILSPDVIWLTIAQGFAHHVNENAETLRHRFVAHEGQAEITVVRGLDFQKGRKENDWPSVFSDFSAQLKTHLGKNHDLIVSSFSTTGPVERAASEIVLMDAVKAYFSYTFMTLCGFPLITLTGTQDDWGDILARTLTLSEFGLGWWTASLIPVLKQFIRVFKNEPDVEFWGGLYSEGGGSGGPFVSGWINTFFPYLNDGKNLVLDKVHDLDDWKKLGNRFGPTPDDYPSGLSVAPFTWVDGNLGVSHEMDFVGGLIGYTQEKDGTLEPKAGWCVRNRPEKA